MSDKVFNPMIKISKLDEDGISVSFTYNPDYVRKIKTIPGHRWHPEGKYWSFPNTNRTLEKILIGSGVDLRYIQEILGHKSSKATEIYTHVSTKGLGRFTSPLDRLNLNPQKGIKT